MRFSIILFHLSIVFSSAFAGAQQKPCTLGGTNAFPNIGPGGFTAPNEVSCRQVCESELRSRISTFPQWKKQGYLYRCAFDNKFIEFTNTAPKPSDPNILKADQKEQEIAERMAAAHKSSLGRGPYSPANFDVPSSPEAFKKYQINCPSNTSKINVTDKGAFGVKLVCLDSAKSPQGPSIERLPSGVLTIEENLLNGLREGKAIWRFKNGKTWWEGTFHQGRLDGPYKEWNQKGELVIDEIFKHNSPAYMEDLANIKRKSLEVGLAFKKPGKNCVKDLWTNGRVKRDFCIENKKIASIELYYLNGKLQNQQIYKDGKVSEEKSWDAEGNQARFDLHPPLKTADQ